MTNIKVDPFPIKGGDKVKIEYDGMLAQNGADQIYLHAEMVNHQDMKDIRDIRMYEKQGIWTTEVDIPQEYEEFNLSFKDSANNLDNNYGDNWTYTIVHS
ncbi:carbohydrate-binding protein [Orenia marismortui]|uniref:carbohydrate-binding protein n=1 Tax=Orenia marismortui TaxID=46469 RepID=UPI00037BD892|nr:carbohydrate-binding protein [Orenia marismortui]